MSTKFEDEGIEDVEAFIEKLRKEQEKREKEQNKCS